MSKSIEIELNYEGVGQLLKSSEMMAICRAEAQKIASQYGGESSISEHVGQTRVNVSVRTSMTEAMDDNKLLKAVY